MYARPQKKKKIFHNFKLNLQNVPMVLQIL